MTVARDPHDELLNEMSGQFVVITDDGAVHHLDLDRRLITSISNGSITGPGGDPSPARLLTLATCRVGAAMVMLIDRSVPGVSFTRRTTTPVSRIRRVPTPVDRGLQKETQ